MPPAVSFVDDPRVRVRTPGSPDPAGRAVVCWIQRAQRADDNPALEVALAPGHALRKPVVALFVLDPNSYAGVAWAIIGKHDRAWGPERPIFGTIRYMSFVSASRKFDGRTYIATWGSAHS
jgi:hypothetical protein